MITRVRIVSAPRTRNVAAVVIALLASAATRAADDSSASDSSATDSLAEITVFGRGESRQVAEVGANDIQLATPGTSPLKVLDKLPGVSFQSADPYGAYEWSTRIAIRGFNQNQLGFTLDGVPLGDMSYGNDNGLHISRAISSENIADVVLSQGAGELQTASSNNLGGTLQFHSADPTRELGAKMALTGGADADRRAFLRLDSGEIGSFGTRGYLSFTDQRSDKWKGYGRQKQQQVNTKIVQPIGSAKLTGFFNWSDRAENDYQDMSLNMLGRLGYNWDNISNNWPLMVQVAKIYQSGGTIYPAPVQSVDDAYPNAAGLRKDKLAGLTLSLPVSDDLSWNTTGYWHKDDGQGVWFTPYVPTPAGAPDGFGGTISSPAPISVRTTEYDINRKGATSALNWGLGSHALAGGLWYENNDFDQARRFYGLDLAAPQRNSLQFMRDPFFTQWQYAFTTKTLQFFLQDTWSPLEALKVNFGFKSLDVKIDGHAVVDNRASGSQGPASGSIESKKSFLPQVGFNYRLGDASELFGDWTRNMRAFVGAVTDGPFATTAAGFDAIRNSLRPETSTTVELGWRYHIGAVEAVATGYHVDFKDRLLAYAPGAGIVGNPAVLQNVGNVETNGAELGLNWRIARTWSWYNSLSLNDSKYKDNVVDASGRIVTATSGKAVVNAPKTLFKSQFGYDDGNLFAKLDLDYTGKRYFTYTNDLNVAGDGRGSVDAYTLLNLGAGYRLSRGLGFLKELAIQANVTNLTDQKYISTIGSNGFVNSGDDQTFLPGAPRQWFLSVSGQF